MLKLIAGLGVLLLTTTVAQAERCYEINLTGFNATVEGKQVTVLDCDPIKVRYEDGTVAEILDVMDLDYDPVETFMAPPMPPEEN